MNEANTMSEGVKTILSDKSFSIVSFLDNPSGSKAGIGIRPNSVKRVSDGEIFSIGDLVTNGTIMKGCITGFNILEGEMYVEHTWSGIGMNLDSLIKIMTLPSLHQIGDKVIFSIAQRLGEKPYSFIVEIKAVHFYPGKVKYDIEIPIAGEVPTRIYNIDSCFVKKINE